MGIQIILKQLKPANTSEITNDKLKICFGAIRFFKEALFNTEHVEIWTDSTSEALGGELIKEFPETNPYSAIDLVSRHLATLPPDQLIETIIVFRGTWAFEKYQMPGYFSVNNSREWRQVYGDIEISAYATGVYEDLVDAFWAEQDAASIVPKFIDSIDKSAQPTCLGLSQVTFSRGIPTEEDPSNLMSILLIGERRGLLGIFYRARRRSNDPEIVEKAEPLDTRFLLSTLVSEKLVTERIDRKLKEALVIEQKTKSALYIAKERNSFEKLYNEISEVVLRPALRKLPKSEYVREEILKGLEEHKD